MYETLTYTNTRMQAHIVTLWVYLNNFTWMLNLWDNKFRKGFIVELVTFSYLGEIYENAN